MKEDQQEYDIFISHSSRRDIDEYSFVNKIVKALKKRGLKVFLDRLNSAKNKELMLWLDDVLEKSKIGLIVLTKRSLESGWVTFELSVIKRRLASKRMKLFILQMEDNCPVPLGITSNDIIKPISFRIPDIADIIAERAQAVLIDF